MKSTILKRKEHIERLILTHQRHLQKLKEHQAPPRGGSFVPPAVLMEIEDIEAEIQQLQIQLEDDNCKNREEIEAVLTIKERRLQILKIRKKGGGYEQEIKEIEAKIQQLATELEQLDN
jgi:hypothetical protein